MRDTRPARHNHSQVSVYAKYVFVRIASFLNHHRRLAEGVPTRGDDAGGLGLLIETVRQVLTQFKAARAIQIRAINRITLVDREALDAATGKA